jgi:hypothetical protein
MAEATEQKPKRAIMPFMAGPELEGQVFNPSMSVRGDHPAVLKYPDRFVDADISDHELRQLQSEAILEAREDADRVGKAQTAELQRLARERQEADEDAVQRAHQEAFERALRVAAHSQKSPLEAGSLHPAAVEAFLLAQAIEQRFTKRQDVA